MGKLRYSTVTGLVALLIVQAAFPLFTKAQSANSNADRFEVPLVTKLHTASLAPKRLTRKQKARARFRELYDKKLNRKRLVKDGLIVQFNAQASKAQVLEYLDKHSLYIVNELGKNSFLLKVKDKKQKHMAFVAAADINVFASVANLVSSDAAKTKQAALAGMQSSSIVESVDVNEYKNVIQHKLEFYSKEAQEQWHLQNDGKNGLKAGADINVDQAWQYTQGRGVKVAVIDTGFDLKHKDINYAETGFNALAVDEDGNISGANEYDASAPKSSSENHGTAVAGIIAAKDNNKGVVGVAPEAEVIPIRLINDFGMVSVAQIIAAHRKADELGAQIINNSWGSSDPGLGENEVLELTEEEEELYKDLATNGNRGKGVLIVFASGNSGAKNMNNAPEARSPYTLAVGATDSTDQRSSYSVYGDELDLVAPGGGTKAIITTDRNDIVKRNGGRRRVKVRGYAKGEVATSFHGTSAAAPVVSGVAALIWSLNPSFAANQVRDLLTDTANKSIAERYKFSSNGKNSEIGYGRVDAGAAVERALVYRP